MRNTHQKQQTNKKCTPNKNNKTIDYSDSSFNCPPIYTKSAFKFRTPNKTAKSNDINSVASAKEQNKYYQIKDSLTNKIKEVEAEELRNDPIMDFEERIFTNGEIYKGAVTDGFKNGKGLCKFKDGRIYDGNWKLGKMEGEGVLLNIDCTAYEGNFKLGVAEGTGKLYYISGEYYEGDFLQWKRHGNGTMNYINGDKYKGKWANEKREGEGEVTFTEGGRYSGKFANDQIIGNGVYVDKKGYKFIPVGDTNENSSGKFENGLLNGMAELEGSCTRYQGMYYAGKCHGKGNLSLVVEKKRK